MLAIPYLAPNGDTLTMRFRRLGDSGPKFQTLPGDKPRPYNTPALERYSADIWITEGEPDTWILHQLGLPSNGIPGANVWKPEWKHIYQPYRTIFIPMDGDDAGKKFGGMLAEALTNVRLIDMGTYTDADGEEKSHDVNSYYLENGPEGTLRKVGA